ncbi:carboxymuconolactone decarboxylase family protein [Alphaproteobacteria bacterium]|nr:carboxymuconolactone decarboxylase family protein [Alphaproteobacteria bacterium]
MYERKHDWREIIKSVDPALEQQVAAFTDQVLEAESQIPRKYKELILMACSAAIRYGPGTRKRGCEAMHHGASDKEVIEALALVSLTSGFTAFADGIEALGDQITVDGQAS